jgi:hypothetical protein
VSVEFEPVQLGPRRRVDPVVIGALVVVVALAAAVVKPWNTGPVVGIAAVGPGNAAQTPSPSAPRPEPSLVSPSPSLPPIVQPVNTAAFATWGRVRAVVEPHDEWGIRAIVGRSSGLLAPPGDLRYEDVWSPVPAAAGRLPTIDIEPDDQTVVAIGITFPPSHAPIDSRIWLQRPDRLEWIDTQAIEPSPSGGGFLYRVIGPGGAIQNWSAGRYRIDVLVDGGIRRFGFTLPNRFEVVPDRPDPAPTPSYLIDPAGGALPDLPIGLFITAGGVSIPLPSEEGPSLTETAAWLNVDPGTGHAPRSHLATVFAPLATGIGVMLPPGSVVERSSVRRLAPEPLAAEPELVKDDPTAGPSAAHVLYRAPSGGAWAPGVYRVAIRWADAAGLHDRSWHLELRPGPVGELPSMLLAARGFARYAGSTGVVVGTAEPLEGGPRAVAIRLLRAGQGTGTGIPPRDRVPCDGVRVDGLSGVVGLAGPIDAPPPMAVARVLFEFNRSGEQPLLTASGDVPGLTLVAPAGEPPLPSDAYQLRVDDTTHPEGATVCLSFSPAG